MAGSSSDELDLGVTVRGFGAGEKVFHRYSLVRVLGRGGMGVVWLARDAELDRNVALKFLPELLLHERALLNNLKSETRRSLELTHRHIVRIYDFIQDTKSSCISMEYVDGDTLSNLRAHKPSQVFELEEVQSFAREICEALEYAHEKAQIVHRDLKPSNVMVNSRGEIKVADFGIARSLSDSVSMMTMSQHTSGTLPYMSPQQLDGERPSPLDDVYSVGAVLYELLTSKPPFFRGQLDHQVRTKVVATIAERRAELGIEAEPVPAAWQETIAACLAKKPSERPQSAREIVARLNAPPPAVLLPPTIPPEPAAPEPTAVTIPIDRPTGQTAPASGQKPLLYIGAGVALLLLVGFIAYFVAKNKPPPAPAVTEIPAAAPAAPVAQPEPPAIGRIVVNTIPANASVYLDGTDRGKTPLILQDVAAGTHHLSVEASGYETTALIADVKPGGTVDFGMMHLRPKPAAPSTASATSTPVSQPLPSAPAATPAATPKTRDLQTEIRDFVAEHLRESVNANISGLVEDYADRVDYYDNGIVDRAFIAKDRQSYASAWPYLKVIPSGDVRLRETGTSGQVTVTFDYSFEARNSKGVKSMGDTSNVWIIDTSYGDLKIVSEKQEITNRRRSR